MVNDNLKKRNKQQSGNKESISSTEKTANAKNSQKQKQPSLVKRQPINFKDLPKISTLPHKHFTHFIIVIAVLVIIYFTAMQNKEKRFATQKETIAHRSQNLECSATYLKDLEKFPNCLPRTCGRLVMDNLLNNEEINHLLGLAKTGMAFGGSDGGASILDLYSGALSKGTQFVNIYKMYDGENIFTAETLSTYKMVTKKIAHVISDKFGVDANNIYLTYPSFFSRITNVTAKTVHDEYWHPHVDQETYDSFHYTSLVYLTDYGKDFKGGRFMFMDKQSDNTTVLHSIEPKRGRISAFTSGAENVHYVEPVTFGTRYALTISFTCFKEFSTTEPNYLNDL